MAVDTAAKRLSMLGFGDDAFGVTPTGTVDAAARASFVDLYQGIALGEAVAAPSIYCDYYAFMSDSAVVRLAPMSDSDYVVLGEIEAFYPVYGFMKDSDLVVTADVSSDDVVVTGTIDC